MGWGRETVKRKKKERTVVQFHFSNRELLNFIFYEDHLCFCFFRGGGGKVVGRKCEGGAGMNSSLVPKSKNCNLTL